MRKIPGGREVRYVSGTSVYVEKLEGDRWLGCGWNVDTSWHTDFPEGTGKKSVSEAFELRIKERPTPPGTLLASGWTWVDCTTLPGATPASVHVVVHLSNRLFPVDLRIHTLLDGTPVLKRWLEITNTSKKPLALTTCIPWSGRLWLDSIPAWTEKAPIVLSHSLRDGTFWEGWFGWTNLKHGSNVFKQTQSLRTDDPYFFLRNDGSGEYFFG